MGDQPARTTTDERGSLIVAMAVVMVLATLSLAVLARTIGGLTSTRFAQDRASALSAADAGLADALFALDQLPTDGSAPASMPPTGTPPRTSTLTSGATFAWRATQAGSAAAYTLISTGTAGSARLTITETATRPPAYPFALFGVDGVFFNGASAGTAPSSGIYAVDDSGAPDGTRPAVVASNHAVVLADGPAPGVGGTSQEVFTPAGSCTGCGAAQSRPGPFPAPDPVLPGTALPCPGGGTVDGTVTPAFIDSGTYLCSGDLTLTGTVSASASAGAPALVYLGPGASLHIGGLTMPTTSDPAGLIIQKAGAGEVDTGDPHGNVTFRGVLYAPHAGLTSNTCDITMVGALTVGQLVCDGNSPAFTLAYPADVEAIRSTPWQVSDYREVPPVAP